MFDKYIVCEDSLQPRFVEGRPAGFQVQLRLPYYRGLGLSMVEAVELSVDGERFHAEQMSLEVHGNRYRVDRLGEVAEDRWEFGERAVLVVDSDRVPASGPYQVDASIALRISYLPFTLMGHDSKTLRVEEGGQHVA